MFIYGPFSDRWYLDLESTSLDEMYSHHPHDVCPECSAAQLENIIGGEACMYSFFLCDGSLLPRSVATPYFIYFVLF